MVNAFTDRPFGDAQQPCSLRCRVKPQYLSAYMTTAVGTAVKVVWRAGMFGVLAVLDQ
jgi:hypothetical protein